MKLLLMVPGGVHPSGEKAVIPALLSLLKYLGEKHTIFVIAFNHHTTLTEYRLNNCQVISLPSLRKNNLLKTSAIIRERLAANQFTPEIIHCFWLGQQAILAGLLKRKLRIPLLVSIAGGEPASLKDIGYGGSRTLKSRLFNRLCLMMVDQTSCGSNFIKNLIQRRWRLDSLLIPLGIDTAFWPVLPMAPHSGNQWQLLHIASINRVKDPWLLLAVIQLLTESGFNFHLNWIGEDTLNGEIQRLVEQKQLSDKVSFLGFKTQFEMLELLPKHQFILQTSRYESQGVALIEAASQGVCPVGTSVGWLDDMQLGISQRKVSCAQAIVDDILFLAKNSDERKNRLDRTQQWLVAHCAASTAEKFSRCYSALTGNQVTELQAEFQSELQSKLQSEFQSNYSDNQSNQRKPNG